MKLKPSAQICWKNHRPSGGDTPSENLRPFPGRRTAKSRLLLGGRRRLRPAGKVGLDLPHNLVLAVVALDAGHRLALHEEDAGGQQLDPAGVMGKVRAVVG